MKEDPIQITFALPKKEKQAFRNLCNSKNASMEQVLAELVAKANREWRIANGQETWDDFNEETKKSILEGEYEKVDSVDDLFKSMGIDKESNK